MEKTDTTPRDVQVDDEGLPPAIRAALVTREKRDLVQPSGVFDVDRARSEFEYRLEVQAKLRPACLAALRPRDFVIMGKGDDAPCYLQSTGAERLANLLGLVIREEPTCERVELEGGEFSYVFSGWIGSRVMLTAEFVIGGRSSNERFFDKLDEHGNRLPVDAEDVRKAAFANWKARGISSVAGLRGLSVNDLRAMGFQIDSSARVAFGEGSKGGAGKAGVFVVPSNFGPEGARGKAWTDISDEDLGWWEKSCKKDLADPAKATYHSATKRRLEAINAEISRRVANRTPA